MDYYDADAVDFDQEDAGFDTEGYASSKELIVFLIDAHRSMFSKIQEVKEYEDATCFELALRVAKDMLKVRIQASESDEIAVVFYGTETSQNPSQFQNVHVFLDLDVPDAMRICSLDELTVEKFQSEIQSQSVSKERPVEALKYALWTTSQMFASSASKASKRIFLLTNNEDPCSGSDVGEALRTQVIARAEELRDAQVALQLFALVPPGAQFDHDKFWRSVTDILKDESQDSWEDGSDVLTQLDALLHSARRCHYKKRATTSTRWHLGENLEIAVQLFTLLRKADKGATVFLDGKTNEELRSETAYVCQGTGAILSDVSCSYFEPASGDKSRYPKVLFHKDEMRAVRCIRPPGLTLLGFKPLSCLKDWHQVSPPSFVFPDEKQVKGSTTAFIAFHDRMLASKKFALCRFVRNERAEPQLVALVPQQEVLDSFGAQIEPPGMQMIHLPYSDDVRYPEIDRSVIGFEIKRATEHQIAQARKVVKGISLPAEFISYECANPAIERHYQVIEAVALQKPVPDVEDMTDDTVPDVEGMRRHLPIVQAFKDAVYPHGAPVPSAPKSGKASLAGSKRKSSDNADATACAASVDWHGLAENGNLGSLTNKVLKAYLQSHGLPCSGSRKADFVERIREHLGYRK
ncbi:unnamed protein product [Ostreobium quekettii]|uniref:ATP-dependent DNA helicase 2 subunit 1 n=1 Tax=Ostreobium quekettii TaxID=121088 RepID=A0A8S1J420_9CHLO|nr:unnamed protein product [Ostreobium quekettii]|eukprot:evm.model.scf_1172.4 EVM.evm.TU.scf_1172.4   scf_1172:17074-24022(+)